VRAGAPAGARRPADARAGKRANVLRNRVDSWDYALDQRLFGTILFTLLAFLFPTVLAYYALFALVRRPPVAAHEC
jgi:hypothetical protein